MASSKIKVRKVDFTKELGDCVVSLTAHVHFNRSYYDTVRKAYVNSNRFTYGVSRGNLPVDIQHDDKAAVAYLVDKLQQQIQKFVEEINCPTDKPI